MKKVLTAICVTILIIIILLISILAINKKNESSIDNEIAESKNVVTNSISNEAEVVDYTVEETNQKIEEIIIYNKVKYVTEKKEYLTVESILKKYVELMGDNEKENLIKLFAPDYLNEFNINKENLKYNFPQRENYTQVYHIDIENILKAETSDRNTLYFITANVGIEYTANVDQLNIMLELDGVKLTYNIYPEEYLTKHALNNLKVGSSIQYDSREIADRDLNKYNYVKTFTDKEMANKLFDDYIYILKVDRIKAYKKLNKGYAKERFNTQEKFNQYIENNKSNIALMKINKYKVYNSDNYTDYICTDQYNNYYIFRQQDGIMRYTVFLDTYTIELDTFKEEYNNSKDDESKLSIQLGKITQMLNNKDYNAIYNKLNETFRNNNFTNVSSLEEYLKNNIYNINSVVISDYEKTDDYYVCKATIQNQKNTNESKDMNLIIKLIDSNNFEMSFSFN